MNIEDLSKMIGCTVGEVETTQIVLRKAMETLSTPLGNAARMIGGVTKGETADGRTVIWSARVRLYCENELMADSDMGLVDGAPGTERCEGLVAVAAYASELVGGYHEGSADATAVQAAFLARLPTLRVAISRNKGGPAIWSVGYTVGGRAWIARAEVTRAAEIAPKRELPAYAAGFN